MTAPFDQLDFIYMPSRDVAADAGYFTGVLGAELVFAIEAMGTRVAMIKLAEPPPRLLLADHVDGDSPILVYRVRDLDAGLAELVGRRWEQERAIELPMGPACSFTTPGGQRIAIYEATRPGVVEGFTGRRDFLAEAKHAHQPRKLARPAGVGRALTAYRMPIEGRGEWIASVRRLA